MRPCIFFQVLMYLLTAHTHASFILSSQQLLAISPKSASCATTGPYASECATASTAVGPINKSFWNYGIDTPGEAAALVATMAFESGDFEYCVHHFPAPSPGQGTRNMQSAVYNLEYARSIGALGGGLAGAEARGPDAVLQLLIENAEYDFGSAAWFLTSQCGQGVRAGLQAGGMEGFTAYLGCTGATATSDRTAYWTAAAQVLGVKSSG